MLVEVTQYMRPNGWRVRYELEIDDKCEDKYQQIIEGGARLTGEQMMTGVVPQTIETMDGDFDIILTKGSDLQENEKALEKRIMRFTYCKFIL